MEDGGVIKLVELIFYSPNMPRKLLIARPLNQQHKEGLSIPV
jgi:hypothetical protein